MSVNKITNKTVAPDVRNGAHFVVTQQELSGESRTETVRRVTLEDVSARIGADAVSTEKTATGATVEIADAAGGALKSAVMELNASQSGDPAPLSPVEVSGFESVTLTRTDAENENALEVEIDLSGLPGGGMYGGTLTINGDGTATAEMTWRKMSLAEIGALDGTWSYYTSGTNPVFRSNCPGRKFSTTVNGLCNAYKFDRSASLSSLTTNVPDGGFGFQSTQTYIIIRDDRFIGDGYASSAERIAAWLSANEDTYIVFPLDESVTIDLDIDQVTLLEGGNILTTDAGVEMTVTYGKAKYYLAEDAEYTLGSLNGLFRSAGVPDPVRGKKYVLKCEWVFPIGSQDPPALFVHWEEEAGVATVLETQNYLDGTEQS